VVVSPLSSPYPHVQALEEYMRRGWSCPPPSSLMHDIIRRGVMDHAHALSLKTILLSVRVCFHIHVENLIDGIVTEVVE
jgi:hypothetical protein